MQKYLLASLKIVNSTTCYLYPQFEYDDENELYPIIDKQSEYPDRGTIYLPKGSEENLDKYQYKLVKIGFDTDNVAGNYNQYDTMSSKCKYYAKISDIEELSRNELIEIISVDKSFDEILRDKGSRLITLPFLPLNKKLILKIDNYCYGPFNYVDESSDYSNRIRVIPDDYQIFKYDYNELKDYVFEAKVTSNYEDPQKMFIQDLEVLENNVHILESIDFIDNEMLIQECIRALSECAEIDEVKQNGLSTLKSLKSLLEKDSDLSKKHYILTEQNMNRLAGLLDDVDALDTYKNKIVDEYFKSGKVSKEDLNLYLDGHPEMIKSSIEQSQEYQESIALLNEKRVEIEEEIRDLEAQKQTISNELSEVQKSTESYKQTVLQTVKDEIDQLNHEKEELRNSNKYIKEQIELAENQKKKLLKNINDLNIDIESKILGWLDSKRDDDVIGLLVSEFGKYKLPVNENHMPQYKITHYDSAEEIIQRVQSYFALSGRETNRNDIINYLICFLLILLPCLLESLGLGKHQHAIS